MAYKAIGNCNVTVVQNGNDDYESAITGTTVRVAGANQLILFRSSPPSPALLNGTYVVSATGGLSTQPITFSSLTTTICTASESAQNGSTGSSTVTFVAEGLCTIAADQAGNNQFAAAKQETQQIQVGKLAQTIEFTSTPPTQPIVGGTYDVSAKGGVSGNAVTFSSSSSACTVADNKVRFVGAGQCTVAANQLLGNDRYKPATEVTQQMMVARAAQSIAFSSTPPNPALALFQFSN